MFDEVFAPWWNVIEECLSVEDVAEEDKEADECREYLSCWQSMIDWFHNQPELRTPVFISIGQEAIRDDNGGTGCVFPRLMIGISKGGSFIGTMTCVTHS